jgi:Ca2+-binding RTX toxin-like protein
LGVLAAPAAAEADTFEVTNLLDDGSGGTLREAVDDAESNFGFDRIIFDSQLTGTLTLEQGALYVSDPVEIDGPGANRVTISGDNASRIFDFNSPGKYEAAFFNDLTIASLTLANGSAPEDEDGGAIASFGADLTLEDAVVTGSQAAEGAGGAIASKYGTVTLESTTISNNEGEEGGGIAVSAAKAVTIQDSRMTGNRAEVGAALFGLAGGPVRVNSSTLDGNQAEFVGGGILAAGANTIVANSTLTGNSAQVGGGVFLDGGEEGPYTPNLTVRNSTVSGNTAGNVGGGVYRDDYSTKPFLLNSIVAGNAAPYGPDIAGYAPYDEFDAEFSLIGSTSGATLNTTTPNSNLIGANPELLPLGNNGGPTPTMALEPTSPAIDKGNGKNLIQDQRHLARPIDFPTLPNSTAAGADGADIGAFELQQLPDCEGKPATIIARPGQPTTGTEGPDVIVGTAGPDQIDALGGNDLVCGRDGDDVLLGRGGKDEMFGSGGEDELRGGKRKDVLSGGPDADVQKGGSGKDTLVGQGGTDELRGNSGNDRLLGRNGADDLFGNSGDDRLIGGRAPDRFDGGSGNNLLYLRPEDKDVVVNRSPNDKVFGEG